jgi:hypothetical protein
VGQQPVSSPAVASKRPARARGYGLVALVAYLVTAIPGALGAQPINCRPGDQPAATLLFPYFEVDLDGGRTTLIAIRKASVGFGDSRLARVTLWTDWAIPTLAFDVFLRAEGVVTLNLRDIFVNGRLPHTGPGASAFPGCPDVLGLTIFDTGALQRRHSGRASSDGMCSSSPRADPTLVTGYITVDATNRCPGAGVTPATFGYFEGANRVASDLNTLEGDFFLVDAGQSYAGGQSAAHVVVPPASQLPGDGDYTFYGRYVGWRGADHRLPLSNVWRTRFLTGGGFDGGTHLIVWRDTRRFPNNPLQCGVQTPGWVPLGEERLTVASEQGQVQTYARTEVFDLATQRVSVASLGLAHSFGSLIVDLDHRNGAHAQAWIGWDANAQSRFNVSLAGIPLADPCQLTP